MRIVMKGGVWKNSEDEILKAAVMKYGLNNWSRVASLLVRKSAKQCKARWYEWLDPSVKKTEWTREEEEKLLHLAKLFPTQWRTIAPIVGRTAHQCLEHYERLLDQAQGKDPDDPNDPRRVKPGEIDPHPETKPSRADPVDMDEDEKEMLAEARARLANTRGKKAKRKAREKQLEEARRLASLQKRRELKAAGIQVGRYRRKRRNQIDYGTEVPFEQQPPAGYHTVGAEENPEGSLSLANISLQQLEGRRRDEEEKKMRKDDLRKLKRLKDDDFQRAQELIDNLNDPQKFRKRTRLTLPEPQLTDTQLEEIVKLGGETAAIISSEQNAAGPTNELLGEYAPPAALGQTAPALRTPGRDNSIMLEAENAAMRERLQTPLQGDTTPLFHETAIGKTSGIGSVTPLRTPNPLVQSLEQTPRKGLNTPFLSTSQYGDNIAATAAGGRSSLSLYSGEDGEASTSMGSGSVGHTARAAMVRLQVRTALANLPSPLNEIEVTLPELPTTDTTDSGKPHDSIEEDMEDILARSEEEKRRLQEERRKKESQVVQQGLPRPLFVDTCRFPSTISQGVEVSSDSQQAALTLLQRGENELHQEMKDMLAHDAAKFPISQSIRPPSYIPAYYEENYDLEELMNASNMLKIEVKFAEQDANDDGILTEEKKDVWDQMDSAFFFNKKAGRYTAIATNAGQDGDSQRMDRVESYIQQNKVMLSHLVGHDKKKANKLIRRINVHISGFQSKAEKLVNEMEQAWTVWCNQTYDLDAFKLLAAQETAALQQRMEEARQQAAHEKSRHSQLQDQYTRLIRRQEELTKLLLQS